MPKFLHNQALLVYLQENKKCARCIMDAIMFSSKASDKKITKNTKVASMHADLKSLIAKVLIVNCNTRAPKISLQTPRAKARRLALKNSVPSPSGAAVQAEWMKSGYIRPEIYQEFRHELD
jgi:hypothetical protein